MSDNNTNNYQPNYEVPKEYKPISVWGYFGYEILFAIPVLGLILMIICCLSKNKNLKNFALSHFCLLVILIVIFAVFFFLGFGEILGEIASEYFDFELFF